MKIRKAVIPAAGLGTRFLPASKVIPKELLPIVDKPSIQYIIEEAKAAGIETIILITSKGKFSIDDHFDVSADLENELQQRGKKELLQLVQDISNMVRVVSVRQGKALGLGHAVYCAKDVVGNEPFAVMLPDDVIDSKKPCVKQLIDTATEYNSSVIALLKVPLKEISRYSSIEGKKIKNGLYKISRVVEKPKPEEAFSEFAIIGRYILTPEIFDALEKTKPGYGGEIQLTDALGLYASKKSLYGLQFDGTRYDSGDKLGYLQANIAYALKRKDLKAGLKKFLKEIL